MSYPAAFLKEQYLNLTLQKFGSRILRKLALKEGV